MATFSVLNRNRASAHTETFYHLSTDKLLGLIYQASEHITPQWHGQLGHIRHACDTCQRQASDPNRFRVSMPKEDCVFNRTVGMNIVKVEKHFLLYVMDNDTNFGSAGCLKGESREKVWEAFLCAAW